MAHSCCTFFRNSLILAVAGSVAIVASAHAAHAKQDPDTRAEILIRRMSEADRQRLILSAFSTESSGVVRGVPEHGIPSMRETDSVTGIFRWLTPAPYVSLPSATSMAASWDPHVVSRAYAMEAREARASGMSVLLAPALNLVRELRGGRTYEYFSEDPLLSGDMAAAAVHGIQGERVISTLKHFAMNDQESGRHSANAIIGDREARESDLLAFEIAAKAQPGAVMCSYNRINGDHACMSDYLLNRVLKQDWGFKGWVMTDWGATTDPVISANSGLDQLSAAVTEDGGPNPYMPGEPNFGGPLTRAIALGKVSPARRDDMARRILRSAIAVGVVDNPPTQRPIDVSADIAISRATSLEGMVLLKNDGILPLGPKIRSVAIIGGHADSSVITKITALPGKPRFPFPPENDLERNIQEKALKAMGSSALPGGPAGELDPGVNPARPTLWAKSSPLAALRTLAPDAQFRYDRGVNPASVSALARESEVVVIFAYQDTNEGEDLRDLRLPAWQEEAIEAAATANRNLVVVLENGSAVTMPWAEKARGILAAWFPGSGGGEAIADILTGRVNPSGKLPISFPLDPRDQPRAEIPGQPMAGSTDNQLTTMSTVAGKQIEIDYRIEGADVGYKWFRRNRSKVAYPFGHGLSYTRFAYSGAKVTQRNGQTFVHFTLRNIGNRPGKEVAQVYLDAPFRLAGYTKIELQPSETRRVSVSLSPLLLAQWDEKSRQWRKLSGHRRLLIGASSVDIRLTTSVKLNGGPLAN